jgi:hypothetical protein
MLRSRYSLQLVGNRQAMVIPRLFYICGGRHGAISTVFGVIRHEESRFSS